MKQTSSRRAKTNAPHPFKERMHRRLREGLFIVSIACALYLFVALVSHHKDDPGWSHTGSTTQIVNLAGQTGAWIADCLFSFFGYIAFLMPSIVGLIGLFFYQPDFEKDLSTHRGLKIMVWVLRISGLVIALGTSCALSSMYGPSTGLPMGAGGLLGGGVSTMMVRYLHFVGATLMLAGFFLASLNLVTGLSFLALTERIGHHGWNLVDYAKKTWKHRVIAADFTLFKKFFIGVKNIFALNFITKRSGALSDEIIVDKRAGISSGVSKADRAITGDFFENVALVQSVLQWTKKTSLQEPVASVNPLFLAESAINLVQNPDRIVPQASSRILPSISPSIPPSEPASTRAPSLALLESQTDPSSRGFSKQEVEHLTHLLEKRLTEFGVQASVIGAHPGPVVTRFELELAPGIKASKVSGLAKDLARSLSIVSVRVVEVIPGKSYIGIEIPNERREIVKLKEILASQSYQESSSPLTLGLGKDIAGKVVSVDLAKMPHLLVAGTTGSGKSVGVNAMLLSILYKATPEMVRMILIDPKMLELSVYDHIPHLLTPVVTDMKEAASALRWCVGEMDSRYQLMAALGVRNLAGYNQKIEDAKADPLVDPFWDGSSGLEPEVLLKKPYIVVVVDEFADMIMVVGKQVEELIARIAQKARAAGIHLILATQRPSVDVITGLIKANIPTRIAFQVSCRIDSRTILDQSGAEQLLGHGDMLYLPPGSGIPQRIHGAFVSDDEVHKVVNEWRKQGKPEYIESIKNMQTVPGSDLSKSGEDEYDELYDEALKIVTESRRASISHLQRRLRIGYNRAACLIEKMESEGVLSAMQSNGIREVLAPTPVER